VVTKSNDFGSNFSQDVKASGYTGGEVCDCCPATLLNEGNKTIILYRNNLNNTRTIWAGISSDNGASFSNGLEVDNTAWMVMSCPSSGPDGVIIGDTLYTVFRSSASGTRVYLSKANINSSTLISSNQITSNFTGLNSQDYPRIAHAGNAAVMVWRQHSAGTGKACISFTNSVQSGFPSTYDSIGSGNVTNLDVTMQEGEIHLVWQNDVTGSVSYRKGTYGTTSVNSLGNVENFMELFPNPATEFIIIPLPGVSKCILVDINGKQTELQPDWNHEKSVLSIKNLAGGLYSLHFMDQTGKAYHSKILVQ
jgi:hypothetical protein